MKVFERRQLINMWEVTMLHGMMDGGRPYSPETVKIYKHYVECFLKKYRRLTHKTLMDQLLEIPPEMFAKRDKVYKALICWAKFLVDVKKMRPSFLRDVATKRPRRHLPPKKTVLTESDLNALEAHCNDFFEHALLVLLTNTGLRVSEAANLKWSNIDLNERTLIVEKGKWGKARKLGLSDDCISSLKRIRPKHDSYVFEPASRYGLYRTIMRIGERAGVKVYPHALRVAFVTVNHKQGVPLQMLQMACGHSDVKTTMGYCQIKEEETVENMKNWNVLNRKVGGSVP